uniref:Uncharacterized protein n=1 Tax=Rhizophora mucronata TaxID=61149 RepID=A0A2P2PJ88_RHIMU
MAIEMASPKPIILVVLPLLLLLCLSLTVAFAASGGRMGGDSFSDPPPSSSDSSHLDARHYYQDHYHHHSHYGGYNGYAEQRWLVDENEKREGSEKVDSSWSGGVFAVFTAGAVSLFVYLDYLKNRGSVIMVQVGLLGKASSLQKELNKISKTAETSSSKGWHNILIDTTVALLRHPDYFVSGYSSITSYWRAESVEKRFKELLGEEREKFDMESLVNVNNVRMQSAVIPTASKLGKNYIVVTLLVAAKGIHKIPAIRIADDMKDALRSLSISSSKLLAVEVLWTPQDENDTLSEQELLEKYHLLRPI